MSDRRYFFDTYDRKLVDTDEKAMMVDWDEGCVIHSVQDSNLRGWMNPDSVFTFAAHGFDLFNSSCVIGICELEFGMEEWLDFHIAVHPKHQGGLIGAGLFYQALREFDARTDRDLICSTCSEQAGRVLADLFAFKVEQIETIDKGPRGDGFEAWYVSKSKRARKSWLDGVKPEVIKLMESLTSKA